MPDQMKARAGKIADLGRFRFELLHVIFAELAQAGCVCLADYARWKYLGNRHQRNRGRITAGAGRRAFDAVSYLSQSLAYAHGGYCAGAAFQSPSSTADPLSSALV